MALSRKSWIFIGVGTVVAAAVIGVIVYFVVSDNSSDNRDDADDFDGPTWAFKCEDSICKRVENLPENQNETTSFSVCRMTCGEEIGTLWPVPSETLHFSKKVVAIDINRMSFIPFGEMNDSEYLSIAWDRFRNMQLKKIEDIEDVKAGIPVVINAYGDTKDMTFDYTTFEGYKLNITETNEEIVVDIFALNFYGVRHALESLSQLIVYDDFGNSLVILSRAAIDDKPKFPHRGVSFDTSRNFYPISSIKKTINGLAMVKLNTFHWHITDSQSFPVDLKSHPEITRLGIYSPEKVYTAHDIKEVVEYAKSRGVRVIVEFDTPAHVGEGFQRTGLVMCYKDPSMPAQWRGHFDPTKDELYDVIDDIYRELVDAFKPTLFHMGADEVNINCWNTSSSIRDWMTAKNMDHTKDGFMELWGYYQSNAVTRLDKYLDDSVPIIIWTSSLTEEPYLTRYLDKDRFIIQVWLDREEDKDSITELLEKGYKVILSNSDSLYLDCGVGLFVDEGLNWCAPYKTWQQIYNNKIENIAGQYINQVYGAEVAIWSESIDPTIVDFRMWPRASALAERLWSDPQTHWRKAEPRLLINRELLVDIGGLAAEILQPEWCLIQEGTCPSG